MNKWTLTEIKIKGEPLMFRWRAIGYFIPETRELPSDWPEIMWDCVTDPEREFTDQESDRINQKIWDAVHNNSFAEE